MKVWQKFWGLVWQLSEATNIGLGRFAPWVFEQMIGCSKKEVKNELE